MMTAKASVIVLLIFIYNECFIPLSIGLNIRRAIYANVLVVMGLCVLGMAVMCK